MLAQMLLSIEQIENYFLDNYGSCDMGPKCQCLRQGWKGQTCSHWTPAGIRNLNDLRKCAEETLQKKRCGTGDVG